MDISDFEFAPPCTQDDAPVARIEPRADDSARAAAAATADPTPAAARARASPPSREDARADARAPPSPPWPPMSLAYETALDLTPAEPATRDAAPEEATRGEDALATTTTTTTTTRPPPPPPPPPRARFRYPSCEEPDRAAASPPVNREDSPVEDDDATATEVDPNPGSRSPYFQSLSPSSSPPREAPPPPPPPPAPAPAPAVVVPDDRDGIAATTERDRDVLARAARDAKDALSRGADAAREVASSGLDAFLAALERDGGAIERACADVRTRALAKRRRLADAKDRFWRMQDEIAAAFDA